MDTAQLLRLGKEYIEEINRTHKHPTKECVAVTVRRESPNSMYVIPTYEDTNDDVFYSEVWEKHTGHGFAVNRLHTRKGFPDTTVVDCPTEEAAFAARRLLTTV